MKTLFMLLTVIAGAQAAHGSAWYDLRQHTSSTTLKISGDIKVAAATSSSNTPTITLTGSTGLITASSATVTHRIRAGYIVADSSITLGGEAIAVRADLGHFAFRSTSPFGNQYYRFQTATNANLGITNLSAGGANSVLFLAQNDSQVQGGAIVLGPKARVGQGAIGSTFDVDGSAQFGTTAISTISTTGSFVGGSNSDVTLSGPTGYIITASSIVGASFHGDGSHLTGIVGVSHVSSYTYVPAITGGAGVAYYVGYATVSITADGINPVEISWNGTYENAGNSISASFQQDNAWYTGFSASIGLTENVSVMPKTLRFVLNNPIPSAGVHKYVFMLSPNGAGAVTSCRADIVCQWGARLLR